MKEPSAFAEGYRYVFGPVPSRRLGRSLGVDLIPYKSCPLNCVYCQIGCTKDVTIARQEFVPFDAVLDEIIRKVAAGPRPDYVTLSGSGEPTLYARLGELIDAIHAKVDVPVAVITNGVLLWDPLVRDAVRRADLVVPSLDAGSPEEFQRVNRPHTELDFYKVVEGLVLFRAEYSKTLWLEVFVLADTSEDEVGRIAALARRILPDRIQVNTVARPAAESWARAASREQLERFAQLLGPTAEIIADFSARAADASSAPAASEVLAMIRRRPCSVEDVAQGLGIARDVAEALLKELREKGAVRPEPRGDVVYFVA